MKRSYSPPIKRPSGIGDNIPVIRWSGCTRSVRVLKTDLGTILYLVPIRGGVCVGFSQSAWNRIVDRGDALNAGVTTSNRTMVLDHKER